MNPKNPKNIMKTKINGNNAAPSGYRPLKNK